MTAASPTVLTDTLAPPQQRERFALLRECARELAGEIAALARDIDSPTAREQLRRAEEHVEQVRGLLGAAQLVAAQ